MTGVLWWLAQGSLVVALLVPAVATAARAVARRPALAHALWLVLLLKFLAPGWIAWPWGVGDLIARPTVQADARPMEPSLALDAAMLAEFAAGLPDAAPAAAEPPAASWRWPSLEEWVAGLAAVWLA